MRRAVCLILLTALPALSHHSFRAEYDIKSPVRLDGSITRFEFINPHAIIHIDAGGENWWIEAASPAALARRGVSKTSLHPGMHVIVEGFRAKDGSHRASGNAITLDGGARLGLRAPE